MLLALLLSLPLPSELQMFLPMIMVASAVLRALLWCVCLCLFPSFFGAFGFQKPTFATSDATAIEAPSSKAVGSESPRGTLWLYAALSTCSACSFPLQQPLSVICTYAQFISCPLPFPPSPHTSHLWWHGEGEDHVVL